MRRLRLSLSGRGNLKSAKARRVEARRKPSSAASLGCRAEKTVTLSRPKTELRLVPGVGPINEQLLCDKGIDSLANLRSIFHDRFDEAAIPFIEYLKQEVGIRNSLHCRRIAGYFKERSQTPGQGRITLSVEGNISAGKTTFLNMIGDAQLEFNAMCDIVKEPVEEWQEVRGRPGNNLLQRYYDDPKRYAYDFQNYVFLTRLDLNRKTFEGTKPLRLIERSVFSDRLVFVRAVRESNLMDDMQLDMYDAWFNTMIREVPGLVPDGFIYLRAAPDTCMKRLQRRNRHEEQNVKRDYLEGERQLQIDPGRAEGSCTGLHEKHEDWFQGGPVIETHSLIQKTVPALLQIKPCTGERPLSLMDTIPIPRELKGSVIWLGENGILSAEATKTHATAGPALYISEEVKTAIHRVPALILDCTADVDVENVETKGVYADKVRKYYEFIQKYVQHVKAYRFWDWEDAEALRHRWHLVNTLPDEHVRQLCRQYKPRLLHPVQASATGARLKLAA